jgi:hypothetical protein
MFGLDAADQTHLSLPPLRQSVQLPAPHQRKESHQFKYDASVNCSNKAKIKNVLQKQAKAKEQRNFQMKSVEIKRKAAITSMIERFREREAIAETLLTLEQDAEQTSALGGEPSSLLLPNKLVSSSSVSQAVGVGA